MNSSVKYMVVADTETGGLPNSKDRAFYDIALVEVACVVIDCFTLEIVDRYSEIVLPYKEGLIYSPKAEETHRISASMMQDQGKDIKIIYKDVKALLSKYTNPRQKAILCGHNFTGFDLPFFENLFEFCGDNLYDYVKWVNDTQQFAYLSSLEQDNYKLGTCCQNKGIDLIEAHRALPDTEANAKLMIEYIKALRGMGENSVKKEKVERFREKFQI